MLLFQGEFTILWYLFSFWAAAAEYACFLHLERWGDTLDLVCAVRRLFSHVVTGSVCCAVLVLCALGPAERRNEQSRSPPAVPVAPPQTPYCEKSLAEPFASSGSAASLSAGQTERHSVLGSSSFFPFSQWLCLISNESKGRICQIPPVSLKPKVCKSWNVICHCSVIHDVAREGVVMRQVQKLIFFFS